MIVQPDFLDHWKTRLLVDLVANDRAPLCLLRLWAHCQQRRTDRHQITPQALAAICQWRGEPNDFLKALLASQFIELDGDTIIVHDWRETNSSLFARWKGGDTTRSKAKPGLNQGSAEAKPRLSQGSAKAQPPNSGLSPGSAEAQPGLTEGSGRARREEKRREEESREEKSREEEERISQSDVIVQYSEAETDLKEISKRVFNRSIAIWNPDWDAGLREAMPAEREQWEALKWLYSLPGNHEIFTNTRVPGWTKRRQDISALIQNLNREQQKSWVSRRDYFDYLAQQKKKREEEPEGYLGMQPA